MAKKRDTEYESMLESTNVFNGFTEGMMRTCAFQGVPLAAIKAADQQTMNRVADLLQSNYLGQQAMKKSADPNWGDLKRLRFYGTIHVPNISAKELLKRAEKELDLTQLSLDLKSRWDFYRNSSNDVIEGQGKSYEVLEFSPMRRMDLRSVRSYLKKQQLIGHVGAAIAFFVENGMHLPPGRHVTVPMNDHLYVVENTLTTVAFKIGGGKRELWLVNVLDEVEPDSVYYGFREKKSRY